ncbi:MAG: type II toxin-antitoxin system RelE/ParE family toxin [Bacteroidia bacterium]|nr:type II toxin-antitoxin system RelE/ParE family toxin [Bacteroidia bacterium]
MGYEIIVRPEAEQDLSEAFLWYEDKRQGLGYDFLLQVDAGLRFISRNPLVFMVLYKGTRMCYIKRFPFKIIYLIENGKIIILGVIHGKRSPKRVKNRVNAEL